MHDRQQAGLHALRVCDGILPASNMQHTRAATQQHTASLHAHAGFVSRFVTYPGTTHGFAVRGSMTDELVCAARDDALRQAVGFFEEVLLGDGSETGSSTD